MVVQMQTSALGHLLGVSSILYPNVLRPRSSQFRRPATPINTDDEDEHLENAPPSEHEQVDTGHRVPIEGNIKGRVLDETPYISLVYCDMSMADMA